MKSVVIHEYGTANEVLKIEQLPKPKIKKNEILIQQYATSVNPIDFRTRSGYGRVLFPKIRGFTFPLVLGRDVSGVIVEVGTAIKDFKVGDYVYGCNKTKAQGAYAEYVVVSVDDIAYKPASLTFNEAASLPYVICTVWDALVNKAGLNPENTKGKRVFIQGGSGGIGSFAVQLIKAWGGYVATTCSTNHVEKLSELGADHVIDYKKEDYSQVLSDFDVALETIGGTLESKTLSILRHDGHGYFTTLIHPLLRNFDDNGLIKGGLTNACEYLSKRNDAKALGIHYSWATYKPNRIALNHVSELIEQGLIKPYIDCEFDLSEIAAAHEYCEQGKSQGKVVIRIHQGI
ncbi:zinc-binding dehydrogenase [bacterium SPL81]|nr:zinc-binding dehydrogenase [Acinetobacter baumannii]